MKTARKNVRFDGQEVSYKFYSRPQLTVYGKLSEFTAGGTGTKTEGKDTKNKTKKP
jgi:hypothetical protein